MVEPVGPSFRIRLRSFDRTDVMRFSIVVPRYDLSQCDRVTVLNQQFPPFGEEPVVGAIDEILVETVWTVVLTPQIFFLF
jgi:hypothetical protein